MPLFMDVHNMDGGVSWVTPFATPTRKTSPSRVTTE